VTYALRAEPILRVDRAIFVHSLSRRAVLVSDAQRIEERSGRTFAVTLRISDCSSCSFSPSGHARTRRWCGNRRAAAALVFFSTRS
jgi:hypothetical protein